MKNRIFHKRINSGIAVAAWLLVCFCALQGHSAEVNITIPSTVSYIVTDVTQTTTGSPDPFTVEFSGYDGGANLRITIIGLSEFFTRPNGAGDAIYVNNISWTAGSPTNGGTTYSGSLLDTDNAFVYEGTPTYNSFPLTWTLDPIGTGVRAGVHTISVQWMIESL